nr:uncharacterized protein LOC106688867 [Halyomorpha halys]
MVSAYTLTKMKKNCTIIPFWLHVVLAFSTLFITAICILSAWPFYLPDHKYSHIENAIYAILSKVVWATNMCWIIMANSIGGENLLSSKILSSKIFVILYKLTLCVLLVHTPLQFMLIMSLRTPQYLTHYTAVWMALGDIFMSYSISFIVYLLVEAPIAGFFIQILKKEHNSELNK